MRGFVARDVYVCVSWSRLGLSLLLSAFCACFCFLVFFFVVQRCDRS